MDSTRLDSAALNAEAKRLAHAQGFDLVGVSSAEDAATHPALLRWLARGHHADMDWMATGADGREGVRRLLPSARSVIVVGINYYQPLPDGAKIARYALGRDYHRVIRAKLRRVVAGLPQADFRVCVDSAPVLERELAQRAGLGWPGKNTMLINSQRGSWFLLGELLTSLEIAPDHPAEGGCGTCRRCVEACPTGAIVFADERWGVDSRRCISYQTIEQRGPEVGNPHGWTFGCDVCQEVCPFNQPRETQPLRAQPTREPDFAPREWPREDEILGWTEAEWDERTQGSPVRRAGYDGLRRNARAAKAQ